MNARIKVSVLMAAYNEPIEWICTSIDSMLSQTNCAYAVELILVLDNPKRDGLFEDLKQRYGNRLIIFKNVENVGLARSLNKAFSLSSGDYLARMDADDISLPHRLAEQVNYLEKHQDVALVGGGIERFRHGVDSSIATISDDFSLLKKLIKFRTIAFHPTWCLRRSVFEALGGYNPLPVSQDFDFLYRLLRHGYRVGNLQNVVLKYRSSDKNTSAKKSLIQRKVHYLVSHKLYAKDTKYDARKVDEYLNSSKIIKSSHELSEKIFGRGMALRKSNPVIAILLIAISALVSPYQAYFLSNNAISRLVIFLHKQRPFSKRRASR